MEDKTQVMIQEEQPLLDKVQDEVSDKREKTVSVINKVGSFLHIPLLKMVNTTGFFIAVYLAGWSINAIYSNIHFDLASLRDFYLMIIGKDVATHGVNSLLNSPKGLMPGQPPESNPNPDSGPIIKK